MDQMIVQVQQPIVKIRLHPIFPAAGEVLPLRRRKLPALLRDICLVFPNLLRCFFQNFPHLRTERPLNVRRQKHHMLQATSGVDHGEPRVRDAERLFPPVIHRLAQPEQPAVHLLRVGRLPLPGQKICNRIHSLVRHGTEHVPGRFGRPPVPHEQLIEDHAHRARKQPKQPPEKPLRRHRRDEDQKQIG